jgi:hypothetical protein
MPLEEALELEKRAYERETARQRRIQEKKERWGCQWPARDQPMTREEREARIWAFMCVSIYDILLMVCGD